MPTARRSSNSSGMAARRCNATRASARSAPVPSPTPWSGITPKAMTHAMIADTVAAFAAAARRVEAGGLDGVELHAAHGYLLGSFLSPATNLRDDDYGGSLENRVRFTREVLIAIRAEVSDDFPVGIRISGDEFIEGGIDHIEAEAIARELEGDIDFLDVSMGTYWRFHKFLSTLDDPLGYELDTNAHVTKVVDVPTIVTGRIMTLDHAEHIVESGMADMVSIVRAMIADPDLVVKAREGREDEIRPCIGTSMGCVAQLMTTGRIQCVVNVAAGAETSVPFETPAPARVAKKVLIVGGGPAGLEAARTAAMRGHTVDLYEMTGALGGQVRMAASVPPRSDLEALTRWLADEIERLGVRVHLRTPVGPDLIVEAAPDEVIVATGSTPRPPGFQLSSPSLPIPGADSAHVSTSWDVLGFGVAPPSANGRWWSTTPVRSRPSRWPTSSSPPPPRSPSSAATSSLAPPCPIPGPPSRPAESGSSPLVWSSSRRWRSGRSPRPRSSRTHSGWATSARSRPTRCASSPTTRPTTNWPNTSPAITAMRGSACTSSATPAAPTASRPQSVRHRRSPGRCSRWGRRPRGSPSGRDRVISRQRRCRRARRRGPGRDLSSRRW